MTDDTITIYRKDTPTIQITIYDYTGSSAFDLTGYTVQLMVKKDEDDDTDSDATLTVDGTVTDAANGIAQFDLSQTNTAITPGNYTYDVQIKKAATSKVYTVSKGTFTVTRDIRRTGL